MRGKEYRIVCITALVLCMLPGFVSGQSVYRLSPVDTAVRISAYEILPDRAYSFETILADSTLTFLPAGASPPYAAESYWIRIKIENPLFQSQWYSLQLKSFLKNKLYYFDPDQKRWSEGEVGILSETDNPRTPYRIPVLFQGKKVNLIYIHADLTALDNTDRDIKPEIWIEKQDIVEQRETDILIAWMVGLTILLLFFFNNLYVYLVNRERVILHYLIGQVGGMMYITSYWRFFPDLLPHIVFSLKRMPDGTIFIYDTNQLFMHVGVTLIMYAIIQFTRTYLDTGQTIPRMDLVLKASLYAYLLFAVTVAAANLTGFSPGGYALLYENAMVLAIIILIIYITLMGYRQKLPGSGRFLLANALIFLGILSAIFFNIFISISTQRDLLIPSLAIVCQAVSFSTILTLRSRSIQQELKTKEIKARKLEFDLRETALRQRLVELENEKIQADVQHEKDRNEWLSQRLEINQRELASTTMYIVQKNEMLAELKIQIRGLKKKFPNSKQHGLAGIKEILQNDVYLESDWRKFKMHFEQVHPHFFEDLRSKYPSLTRNDVRLYTYFHLNLTTKEIAALLNIAPSSVRQAKTRLYKKMGLAGRYVGEEDEATSSTLLASE